MEIEVLLDVNLNKLIINFLVLVISIVMYVITDILIFLIVSFAMAILLSLNLYFYIKNYKRNNRLMNIKKGHMLFPTLEVNYNDFINMCRKGLPYSVIKLDNNIYTISSVLYEDLETDDYKFIITINNKRYKKIESLLNYKFNGKRLTDYKKIVFIEIDGNDPKDYYWYIKFWYIYHLFYDIINDRGRLWVRIIMGMVDGLVQ